VSVYFVCFVSGFPREGLCVLHIARLWLCVWCVVCYRCVVCVLVVCVWVRMCSVFWCV